MSCLLPEAGLVDSLGQGGTGGSSVATGGAGSGGASAGGDGAGGSSGSQGGTSISGQANGGSSSAGGGAGGAGGTSSGTGGAGNGGTTITIAGGAAGVAGGLAGGGGALIDVAAALDGQKYMLPCGANFDIRTCNNVPAGGQCPNNPEYILDGAVNRNDTVQFGGAAGVIYNVTIRVQGIVESRSYTGGSQQAGGWYAGGAPPTNVAFNVYLLRVSSPAQDYFLNSLPNPGAHSTFVVDYQATFPIEGGAQVQFVLSDSNCLAFKNCEYPDGPNCTQQSIPTLVAEYPEIPQPYNGQFIVIDVVSVTSG